MEIDFCVVFGCKYVVVVCFVMVGMYIILMVLGIGLGDEVIILF